MRAVNLLPRQQVQQTRERQNPVVLVAAIGGAAVLLALVGGTLLAMRSAEKLADIAVKAGIERQRFFAGIETDSCKSRLRANTDELIARGGFGSPSMFVGEQMFFGNDRLPLVRAALLG